MKVVLIYLPHPYLKQPDAQIPLGILYLASVLRQRKINVEVKNYSSFTTEEAINDLPQANIYGITVTSMELLQANRFARLIKKSHPKSKIFLGGAGAVSYEFVNWNYIDSICKGDGEITILKMINDVTNKCLKKVYYGETIKDLDSLPFPARDLLTSKGGNIFAYNKNYKGTKSVTILSSRGCPFTCAFCSAPSIHQKVRFRSPVCVANEIKHIIEKYGIRQFRFSDDMFTANRQRVIELCKLIKDSDIAWRVSIRVKPLDEELLQIMYDAGCKEVSFGVESFDNHVLKVLNKHTKARHNVRALEICKKIGLKTRILFMIRTPGQTKDTVRINIEYLKKVPYDIIACTSFVPLPGSDIWANPDKYGITILNKNLDDYNFYFFGSEGENQLKDVIKLNDRSLEEFNQESQDFRDYLKGTGKLNEG